MLKDLLLFPMVDLAEYFPQHSDGSGELSIYSSLIALCNCSLCLAEWRVEARGKRDGVSTCSSQGEPAELISPSSTSSTPTSPSSSPTVSTGQSGERSTVASGSEQSASPLSTSASLVSDKRIAVEGENERKFCLLPLLDDSALASLSYENECNLQFEHLSESLLCEDFCAIACEETVIMPPPLSASAMEGEEEQESSLPLHDSFYQFNKGWDDTPAFTQAGSGSPTSSTLASRKGKQGHARGKRGNEAWRYKSRALNGGNRHARARQWYQ